MFHARESSAALRRILRQTRRSARSRSSMQVLQRFSGGATFHPSPRWRAPQVYDNISLVFCKNNDSACQIVFLDAGTIPVYMGTDKVNELLGGNLQNSIIQLSERLFATPKKLAEYLLLELYIMDIWNGNMKDFISQNHFLLLLKDEHGEFQKHPQYCQICETIADSRAKEKCSIKPSSGTQGYILSLVTRSQRNTPGNEVCWNLFRKSKFKMAAVLFKPQYTWYWLVDLPRNQKRK